MAKKNTMQERIYEYIAQFVEDNGYPPSVREIGEAMGLKSPSTVHFHLKNMEEKGLINKGAGKGRAVSLVGKSSVGFAGREEEEVDVPAGKVPIVGNVAAGTPILAQECI